MFSTWCQRILGALLIAGLCGAPVHAGSDSPIDSETLAKNRKANEVCFACHSPAGIAKPPRADLDNAALDGTTARLTVRFLAEFRTRGKGPEGETVDDRRTAELWTFERDLKSKDPNWILIRVDAAEA